MDRPVQAADLPLYSIVASISFVFLRVKEGPAGCDEQVDHYIATIGAEVLRIGGIERRGG